MIKGQIRVKKVKKIQIQLINQSIEALVCF